MKLTLERLIQDGLIKEDTGPIQKKRDSILWKVVNNPHPYFTPSLLLNYGEEYLLQYSSARYTRPDCLNRYQYIVVNDLLLPKISDKGFFTTKATSKKVRDYIDNMSEEEYKARLEWFKKIVQLTRFYQNDPNKHSIVAKIVGDFK